MGASRNRKVAAAVAATLSAVAAIVFWFVATASPAIPSVRDGETNLEPGAALTISVWNLGGSLQGATLSEAIYDIYGNPGEAREIPVKLTPIPNEAWPPLRSDYRIERADGGPLMAYDGLYRLTLVAGSRPGALLGQGRVSTTYTYTTLPSPRLFAPEGVVPLDYQKPLELRWSHPVRSLQVETVPPLEVRTWIDPARRDVSFVELIGARPDTEYQVRVVDALAVGGGRLVAPAQVRVLTPAPPDLVRDAVKIEDGYAVTIPWDRPIKSFDYEISPPVDSVPSVETADPRQSRILLRDPRQGQEYTITIKSALAATGYPMSGTRQVTVRTPDPLKIDKFEPGQPKFGVPLDGGIDITFSRPVKNRALAERAIKIEPAIPGRFVWKAPNVVQFAPEGRMPGATDFTVSVLGGREGALAQDGGYLDKTEKFTFWTAPEKLIEVNLTTQTLTLWEGGYPVWDTLVSTGVRFAETPTGLFTVQYKMASTRMRGVNPSGLRYDLPNVPWVMPFLGDYTIHGAYWRSTYGVPQSNGCVSMPVGAAKHVYDWTPEGTPVRIHY